MVEFHARSYNMPAIGNITINDATPAARVFVPRRKGPENAIWSLSGWNASNTFAAADCSIRLGVSPASARRPTIRTKMEISIPNPSYVVADESTLSVARVYVTTVVPDDFSQTDRDHVAAITQNLVADGVFDDAVADGAGQY
jgi:hypothetical protein